MRDPFQRLLELCDTLREIRLLRDGLFKDACRLDCALQIERQIADLRKRKA